MLVHHTITAIKVYLLLQLRRVELLAILAGISLKIKGLIRLLMVIIIRFVRIYINFTWLPGILIWLFFFQFLLLGKTPRGFRINIGILHRRYGLQQNLIFLFFIIPILILGIPILILVVPILILVIPILFLLFIPC